MSDGRGKIAEQNITITVKMFTTPPKITTRNEQHTKVSKEYRVQYTGEDPDGDNLTWQLETNGSWLILSDDGLLHGTVPEAAAGKKYLVKISLSDGKGGRDVTIFTLRVGENASQGNGGDGKNDETAVESSSGWLYAVIIIGVIAFGTALTFGILGLKKKRERGEDEEEDTEDYAEIVHP